MSATASSVSGFQLNIVVPCILDLDQNDTKTTCGRDLENGLIICSTSSDIGPDTGCSVAAHVPQGFEGRCLNNMLLNLSQEFGERHRANKQVLRYLLRSRNFAALHARLTSEWALTCLE